MQIELMSITDNAEDVIERACRTCYLSFNRYKQPDSAGPLIQKVIRKGHYSVLEHAMATFRIKDCSRVMTHELVRHRIMSPSQESQRYCVYANISGRKKTKDFDFVIPQSVSEFHKKYIIERITSDDPFLPEDYISLANKCWKLYERMLDDGVPPEDARYILPNATTSEIVVSANLREWRHIFEVRGNPRAHWEIRRAIIEIFRVLKEKCPNVFFDFEESEECLIKNTK